MLKPGATIVETTSGNTGFAIAMNAIVKGYKCIVAVSDKTKEDKIAFLKALGAEVHMCPANVPADDPRSYYETARRIAEETPNSIYINQYFNPKISKPITTLRARRFGNKQRAKSHIYLLALALAEPFQELLDI